MFAEQLDNVQIDIGTDDMICQLNENLKNIKGTIEKIPYSGAFSEYLKENNFGYNKIYSTLVEQYEADSNHQSFVSGSLKKEWGVFKTSEIFFNRELIQRKMNVHNIFEEHEQELNNMIECAKTCFVFQANEKIQGHVGKFHGGFTATLSDELMGMTGMFCAGLIATINLNTTYKAPLNINEEYLLVSKIIYNDEKDIHIQADIMNSKLQIAVTSVAQFRKLNMKRHANYKQAGKSFSEMMKSIPNLSELIEEEIQQGSSNSVE